MPYGYDVKKVDLNHDKVREGLLQRHYGVFDIHAIGGGAPDLLALTPWGVLELLEVKQPSGKLNDNEIKWHREWASRGGHVHIAYSAEQIDQELRKEREKWLPKTTPTST
jgi:hypothetical protein